MTVINRTISTREEVAALVTEPEGETIDYKGTADPDEWWELAKDIAAFANHMGGVIVVGAHERNGKGGLPSIQGLPPDKVRALATAYENVAKERCRPSPLVICEKISWSDGHEVLAVNVEASASGLVAARFYAANKNGKNEPANAWQFVKRIGKHNVELPLEQAIMHMSTETRRTIIRLEQIPRPGPVRLIFHKPAEEKVLLASDTATLRGFSIERNVALITFNPDDDIYQPNQAVPLDDIVSIWSGEDGLWAMRIDGYFENWIDIKGARTTEYIPYSG